MLVGWGIMVDQGQNFRGAKLVEVNGFLYFKKE